MAYSDIVKTKCIVCNKPVTGHAFAIHQRLRGHSTWIQCASCGSYFSLDEEVKDEQFVIEQNLWGKVIEGTSLASSRRFMYAAVFELIKAILKETPLKCLDIGASYGGFAEYIKQKQHDSYATDIHADAVRYLQGQGIHAVCEPTISAITLQQYNNFDIITAFDCMYYWRSIYEELQSVHQRLKPGGLFVIRNSDKSKMLALGKMLRHNKIKARATHDHTSVLPVKALTKTLTELHFEVLRIDFAAAQPQQSLSPAVKALYRLGGLFYKFIPLHLAPGYVMIVRKK